MTKTVEVRIIVGRRIREARNKLKNIKSKQKFAIHLDIKNLRTKTGLNQVEFAKKAGVGLRFLRELEQGKISLP